MNGDGTGLEQLTFNPGTVFDPTVLADGKICFSLWDTFLLNVPPADKHETYLMTVMPDGTQETFLFGAGQHRYFNRERHSGIALTQPGPLPNGRILTQSELGPSIVEPAPRPGSSGGPMAGFPDGHSNPTGRRDPSSAPLANRQPDHAVSAARWPLFALGDVAGRPRLGRLSLRSAEPRS